MIFRDCMFFDFQLYSEVVDEGGPCVETTLPPKRSLFIDQNYPWKLPEIQK